MSGSNALKASSMSRIDGSLARARARPTRCCMPPDNCEGIDMAYLWSPTSDNASIAELRRSGLSTPCTSSPYATLSMTFLCGNNAKCWNTIPIFSRRTACSARPDKVWMSTSSTQTLPAVTECNWLTVRIAVDFPDPESPIITKSSP